MTRLLCAALLTVIACSGGAAQKRPTPIAERGSGSATEPRETGSATPNDPSPTAAECDALVAHVVQLARAEQPTATADDAAQTTTKLAPFTAECATQTTARVRCATNAPTLAELAGCGTL